LWRLSGSSQTGPVASGPVSKRPLCSSAHGSWIPPCSSRRPSQTPTWTGGPHLRRRTFSCWDSNQENSCQDCPFSQQRFFFVAPASLVLRVARDLDSGLLLWVLGFLCSLDTSTTSHRSGDIILTTCSGHTPSGLARPSPSSIGFSSFARSKYFLVPAQTVHLANPANSVFCHPIHHQPSVFFASVCRVTPRLLRGYSPAGGDRVCIPQYLLCLAILF
jgi:hypothetical protein